MYLATCGDPDCPNKRRVEELEQELRKLREQMAGLSRDGWPTSPAPRGKCGIRYHHKDCSCRGEGGDR